MISPTESRLQETECFHFLFSRRTYYNSVPPRSQCPLFRVPRDREERRGEERKDSVRCTVSWPHFPLTRVRSVETNLALICPSPTSFTCNLQILDHTQPGSLSLSLSQSVGTVRRESLERGWTPSS